MGTLKIKMFGSLQVGREEACGPREEGCASRHQSVPRPCGRSAQALLAYLVLHRNRMHRREALAGLLWGEASEERARGALRTALWRLRRVVEPPGVPTGRRLVTTRQGEVGFEVGGDVWVDAMVFENVVAAALASRPEELGDDHAAQLEAALRLYEGELLEGFYDDWVLRERERLRALYLQALTCLMHGAAARGDLDVAIGRGRQLLLQDPLRESLHREVMRLYLRNGQRAQALRQFVECRRVLDEELQVEPMPETLALQREISRGPLPGPRPGLVAEEARPGRLQDAMASLRRALVELRHVQGELDDATGGLPP